MRKVWKASQKKHGGVFAEEYNVRMDFPIHLFAIVCISPLLFYICIYKYFISLFLL